MACEITRSAVAGFALMFAAATLSTHAAPAAPKPNVVVILADDLGFGDLGFTGSQDVKTPRSNSLAAGGVTFTQGYVASSLCSPSRAGLLTGRYPQRWGHDNNDCEDLDPDEQTLGDRMRSLGYVTGMIGKWHLGQRLRLLPTTRGFDEVFHPAGNAVYFGAKILDSLRGQGFQPPEDATGYTTELNSARAADFIRRHRADPFCLYVALNNAHGPLQVPAAYRDRVTATTDNADRCTMLAMLLALDDAVGVILDALAETDQADDTLVFFLNDNGSYEKLVKVGVCVNKPFTGGKSTLREGGIRVPFVLRWPARLPAGKTFAPPVSSLDVLPTAIAAAGGSIEPAWRLDGVDLLPFLDGAADGEPHRALYWRMDQKRAIRKGNWKLLVDPMLGGRLYDVTSDPGEARNLAAKHPEIVADLAADWNRWNAELPPARPPAQKEKSRPKKRAVPQP